MAETRPRPRRAAEDRDPDRAESRRISCRKAACSGTAAPTPCRSRRQCPLLDPREMDGGSIEISGRQIASRALCRAVLRPCSASAFSQDPQLLVVRGDVRRRTLSDRGAELPSLHQQVRLLAGGQSSPQRERNARLSFVQRSGQSQLRRLPYCRSRRRDGLPPLFTDHQYEALGAPRNAALADNQDPNYFDLGVCGPIRTDIADQTQYCGMFKTPTLRNTAVRRRVLPQRRVPHAAAGAGFLQFPRHQSGEGLSACGGREGRRSTTTFRRSITPMSTSAIRPSTAILGDTPAMTAQDEADIIAFLKTLNDGYKPND